MLFLTHTMLDEVGNGFRPNEVDKGISNVKVVGKTDAQVRKVVVTLGGSVEEELQVFEVDAVRMFAQHDGGTDINAGLDLAGVDSLRLVVLICTLRMIRSLSSLCVYARCFELTAAAVVGLKL
jgi:hypothetical protein